MNAADESLRLEGAAGGSEVVFVSLRPKVSHWTTKTPKTTVKPSVLSIQLCDSLRTVDYAQRVTDICYLTGSINKVDDQIDCASHKCQGRPDNVPPQHFLHIEGKLIVSSIVITTQDSSQGE